MSERLECPQHVSRFSLLALESAWVCLAFAYSWTLRVLMELCIRFCLECVCYVWVISPVSSCRRVPGEETTRIHWWAPWDGREIYRRPTAGPGGTQLQITYFIATIQCFWFSSVRCDISSLSSVRSFTSLCLSQVVWRRLKWTWFLSTGENLYSATARCLSMLFVIIKQNSTIDYECAYLCNCTKCMYELCIVRALKTRKKPGGEPVHMIGDVLASELSHMQAYICFCSCQLNAAALIQQRTDQEPDFKTFMKVKAHTYIIYHNS